MSDAPDRDRSAHASGSAVTRLLDRPIDPADLTAQGDLVARPREARTARRAAFVIFQLGPELLALPVGVVRRVVAAATVRPIPHRTNDVLRGVCNVRGEIVLAADLRRLLGLPATNLPNATDATGAPSNGARRMLVLDAAPGHRGGGEPWAAEVDAVLGVDRIDPADVRATPTTVDHARDAYTDGLVDLPVGLVAVLDAERVLGGLKAALR